MIKIRNGVFETNSSSSHSIVVTKTDNPLETVDPEWRMRDGEIKFWYEDDLEFGRTPFNVLSDWYGRLRYTIASLGETHMDEIVAACKRHIPGFDHFKFPTSRYEDGGEILGYVDHQSIGLLRHTLIAHHVTMDDFIFNDKYIVIIDGDEYCVFNRLRNTPMFDENAIDYLEEAND